MSGQIAVILGRAQDWEDAEAWIVSAFIASDDSMRRAKRWVQRANDLSRDGSVKEIDAFKRLPSARTEFARAIHDEQHLGKWMEFSGWPEYEIVTPSTSIPRSEP